MPSPAGTKITANRDPARGITRVRAVLAARDERRSEFAGGQKRDTIYPEYSEPPSEKGLSKMMMKPFQSPIVAAATLAIAFACAGPVWAAPTAPVPHGTVTLISESGSLSPQRETWFGLHFVLEPGWHTYWVNPGDAGTAPKLTWKLPAGFQAGPISWPTPQRLPVSKLIDYGYEKDVTLLVPIRGTANAQPAASAEVSVQVSVVVCKDLCIPGKAQLSLALPVRAAASAPSAENAALFAAARGRLPKPLPAGSTVRVADAKDEFVLIAETGKQPAHALFFPQEESQIDNAAPQPVEAAAKGFRLRLKKSPDLEKPAARLRGVLDLDGAGYLVDLPVTRSSTAAKSN
jgi:thiol:disulfide interchange protein DsbD